MLAVIWRIDMDKWHNQKLWEEVYWSYWNVGKILSVSKNGVLFSSTFEGSQLIKWAKVKAISPQYDLGIF